MRNRLSKEKLTKCVSGFTSAIENLEGLRLTFKVAWREKLDCFIHTSYGFAMTVSRV